MNPQKRTVLRISQQMPTLEQKNIVENAKSKNGKPVDAYYTAKKLVIRSPFFTTVCHGENRKPLVAKYRLLQCAAVFLTAWRACVSDSTWVQMCENGASSGARATIPRSRNLFAFFLETVGQQVLHHGEGMHEFCAVLRHNVVNLHVLSFTSQLFFYSI